MAVCTCLGVLLGMKVLSPESEARGVFDFRGTMTCVVWKAMPWKLCLAFVRGLFLMI